MAFMLLGTFAHLLDNISALQCLASIHAALKPGGKLVLELSHPTDIFDGSLVRETEWSSNEGESSSDEGESSGDESLPSTSGMPGELALQYGKEGDDFNAIDQVSRPVTPCKALAECLHCYQAELCQ